MDIFRKNKIEDRLIGALNNLTLNRKLLLLYLLCVLLPLLITDGYILTSIVSNERSQFHEEMQNVAKNVSSDFVASIKTASDVSNIMYVDRSIYSFLDTPFTDESDFYSKYYEWIKRNGYQTLYLPNLARIIFVADNNTIVPGGNIFTLKSIKDNNWYQAFIETNQKPQFIFYFMGDESGAIQTKTKQVKLVRWLDYHKETEIKKMLVINLDYSKLISNISGKNYGMLAYICDGDKVVISTDGNMDIYSPFKSINDADRRKVGYTSEIDYMGKTYTVMVFPDNSNVVAGAFKKKAPVMVLLLALNILMPLVLVRLINQSFINRLGKLNKVFESGNDNVGLVTVNNVEGSDEIAHLMNGYNDLVLRNRQLIKTIYEDKLVYQENEIEKQQAELLAMRMQINPHFLFNCLENVRMHSVIKGEKETAAMIERLAALERDVVEWNQDVIPLYKEMSFIKNYLKLQQYRYGDRFSFSINVTDDVSDAAIPKLTLATFVENACVHGAEKKTRDVVIIINAHASGDRLVLEIEDTGAGMDSASAERLQKRMRECTFADLKRNKHIGILNACLRTKLIAGGDVDFLFESEEQIGTYIKITMPLKHYELQQGEGGEE
ncbi:MAG: histidine kinase [Clostridiales bacterium]|nr:histidine kinase [Clostridiales bacterium]MBR6488050.1 histidine kinase [Clostridiales bacterium]